MTWKARIGKAFLVCKSGCYCHPRWMGSGDGLKNVREKWGAVKFLTPAHLASLHFSPVLLAYHFPCLCQPLPLTPNKIRPTIVLHLLTLSCWCVTSFSFCSPLSSDLCACSQFYTTEICPFPLFPFRPCAGHSYFYSPQNSPSFQNTKGFLICRLCFYLIIWVEVFSAGAAERFLFL